MQVHSFKDLVIRTEGSDYKGFFPSSECYIEYIFLIATSDDGQNQHIGACKEMIEWLDLEYQIMFLT